MTGTPTVIASSAREPEPFIERREHEDAGALVVSLELVFREVAGTPYTTPERLTFERIEPLRSLRSGWPHQHERRNVHLALQEPCVGVEKRPDVLARGHGADEEDVTIFGPVRPRRPGGYSIGA